MLLKRLSIRSKLALVAVLPLATTVLFAYFAWATLQAVKVGSPAERRVVDAQNIVADVLPPPMFVVEPFLLISLAADPANAANRDDLLTRYRILEHEYRVQHRYWVEQSLPTALRTKLLVESYDSAQRFFDVVDDEIVPLIKAGDPAATALVTTKLAPIFDEHRATILRVIAEARQYEDGTRDEIAGSISDRTTLFLAGLVVAGGLTLLLTLVIGRTIREAINRLRKAAEEDLPRVMAELRDADDATLATARLEPVDTGTQDELAEAAEAFNAVLDTAVGLAAEQSVQRRHTSEMFVNLGRRNQNLVSRQLKFIDSLERTESDGDRLAELFRLDNLATRMRRNAESLLVLAGVEPPRRWRRPVRLYDVVRGAMAEIEEFRRVEVGAFDEVLLQGSSVANVTHLLAELLENAARFSPPDTTVTVNGVHTGEGYLIGIHDRGLGMAPDALAGANERLRVAQRLDEVPTAYLGLFVVARLAGREGITVELESPEGDGLTAWIRLPADVLASPEPNPAPVSGAPDLPERSSTRRLEIAARADQLADRQVAPVALAAAPLAAAPPRPPVVPSVRADAAPPAPPAIELSEPARAAAVAPLPSPSGAPLPPPAAAPAEPAATGETRSGFKRRTKGAGVVDFDRFAVRPAPTGTRSAEDMKDRLDRFSAGKRFASAQAPDIELPEDLVVTDPAAKDTE